MKQDLEDGLLGHNVFACQCCNPACDKCETPNTCYHINFDGNQKLCKYRRGNDGPVLNGPPRELQNFFTNPRDPEVYNSTY